jgi:lipid-A-disaccharide synthase
MRRILIVAGEASADRYGARLVRRLYARRGEEELRFYGTGGDEMQREGVELLCHIRDLASIGPREALANLTKYFETFQNLVRVSQKDPPALAILLDFPEFNLRLAKKLKRAGIKVVYYISPQLWAWRSGRVRIVRRYVDKMLVILPFEEEFYRLRGVDVEFVGHPLLEDFSPNLNRVGFLRRLGFDPDRTTVALLPGSRRKEVEYMLPTLLKTSQRILRRIPAQFLISAAPALEKQYLLRIVREALHNDLEEPFFKIVTVDARDILANSDFAFVKSGTSTLEAALVGTPFLIIYKISPASWYLGNILIRTPFKGLVNLIAREEIVPEYLQRDATPESLSHAALEYLQNSEKASRMKSRLSGIREKLGRYCASERAATTIEGYL